MADVSLPQNGSIHPDLRYPGWSNPAANCQHQAKCGCRPDPLTEALVQVEMAETIGYLDRKVQSGEIPPEDAREKLKQYEKEIRETVSFEGQEWEENCFTILDEGEIKWVSHVDMVDFLDIFVLDRLRFVRVSIDASPVFPGKVRITFEAADKDFPLPPHPDMPKDETWLYRMFDDAGVLLYIGISKDAFTRFSQHSKDKPWVDDVAKWTREKFSNRQAALIAEKKAIKSEHPLYNVVHNTELK